MKKLKFALFGIGVILLGMVLGSQIPSILALFPKSIDTSNIPVTSIEWMHRSHQNRISKVETETILFWARKAVNDIYTLSYSDYYEQLEKAASYFSKQGWARYRQMLAQSKNIEALKEKQGFSRIEWDPRQQGRLRVDQKNQQFFVELPIKLIWQFGNRKISKDILLSLQLDYVKTDGAQLYIQHLSERELT